MRRLGRAAGLAVLVALVAGLVAGSAAGAGGKKLVEGTVYDVTCTGACAPECPPPPHCGPITQSASSAVVCAQQRARLIVCPLAQRTIECVQAPCPGEQSYPVYAGEGGVVKVRKRGSTTVLATLPIVEGHFKIRLGFGYYAFRPFLPEPECWSGAKTSVWVSRELEGPVPAFLHVSNTCVAHPDGPK